MASKTLTINHAGGGSETYTVNRDKFAGVRQMSVDGQSVEVDHTAVPKEQSRETTFGGTQSITIKRDIEPLLTNVVGGASAAYSLRDLNDKAGNSKVVKVRRSSDQAEKTFTAKEVPQIADWVNGKQDTTLPADVSSAAAAYSLRKVKSDYTGNAVQIRRTSDNVEVNVAFDSNGEVSDSSGITNVLETPDQGDTTATTLAEFLNESLDKTQDVIDNNRSYGFWFASSGDATNITSSDELGFQLNGSVGNFHLTKTGGSDFFAPVGSRIVITYNASNSTSMLRIVGKGSSGGGSDTTDVVTLDNGIGHIATLTPTEITRCLSVGVTGTDVSFNITKVVIENHNASVVTWYDQSGNGNHATQDVAGNQPLIAENGSLNTKLGKTAIDFTTGTTFLDSDGVSITESEVSYFILGQLAKDGATSTEARNKAFLSFTSDSTYIASPNSSSQTDWRRFNSIRNFSLNFQKLNTTNLHTAIGTSSGANYYLNGSSIHSDSITGTNFTRTGLRIGTKFSVTSHDMEGYFSEFIIYNSDQSANRFKIESNINNHYGIYTGTEDGFVETWYDQSGNNNHATQTFEDSQPRIVEGGLLVERNGNPAVKSTSDNLLEFTLDSLSSDGQQSVFTVLENDVTSQDGFGRVFRAVSTTSNGGLHNRPWWYGSLSGDLVFAVGTSGSYTNSDREYRLYSHIMNDDAGGTSTVHQDGTQVDTRSITLDANPTFNVGRVAGVTSNATGALYMSEVVYYTSDQSANRPAIEKNINNHYEIF